MNYIITTQHLTKNDRKFTAVSDVSLHIRKGKRTSAVSLYLS